MIGYRCTLMIFICLLVHEIDAQSRSQLEDERKRIIQQIEQTSTALERTQNNKNATLEDLKAIELQVKNRQKLIQNIKDQLENADKTLSENKILIDSLNTETHSLVDRFGQLSRKLYLKKMAENKWAFVLSTKSINDAFLRWRYGKQYEQYVTQKAESVGHIKQEITTKTENILEEKTDVEKLLVAEKENHKKLEADLKKKDVILSKLKKEEATLRKNLEKKKAQREKLNDEIERIIVAELSKKKNTTNNSSDAVSKKKLEWPSTGYVSSNFGTQAHPTIPNVTIKNNGIDITNSKPSSPVSSVAAGVVVGVTTIPGYDYMVIVQHGDYYSVYSRIAHVIVNKDDKVSAGQTIGRLSDDDNPILHFEFWKGKEKLNPTNWLKNR